MSIARWLVLCELHQQNMSRLTDKQLQARYEAYLEASGHLRLDWTEDETERVEGNKVADMLERQALKWLRRKSTSNG